LAQAFLVYRLVSTKQLFFLVVVVTTMAPVFGRLIVAAGAAGLAASVTLKVQSHGPKDAGFLTPDRSLNRTVAAVAGAVNLVGHNATIMDPSNHGAPATHDKLQEDGVYEKDLVDDGNGVTNMHAHRDPHWDEKEVQTDEKYESDFVSDDRNTYEGTTIRRTTEAPFTTAYVKRDKCGLRMASRSEEWYRNSCSEINSDCDAQERAVIEAYNDRLEELYQEYVRQKRIFEGKEVAHAEERDEAATQHRVVKHQKMQVDEAKVAVRENAHCPPELVTARDNLVDLESIPDKTPEDIDAECRMKKKVLELEACVVRLREAEQVLYEEEQLHKQEHGEHSREAREELAAESALPPQERRMNDAKQEWLDYKAAYPSLERIREECQDERDALIAKAEADINAANDEYLRQKTIMESRENNHRDERQDVADQEARVSRELVEVKEAKRKVEESEHCPPELEDAKHQLAQLQAIADKTPSDIDAECVLKKKILELEKCVEVLREAEGFLTKQRGDYVAEEGLLGGEQTEERGAARRLPPQQVRVQCAKDSLQEARAARRALAGCGGDPAPAPAPPPSPSSPPAAEEAKSGANRPAGFSLLAAAAFLCSLVQA